MVLDKRWHGLEGKTLLLVFAGITEAGRSISDAELVPEVITEEWTVQIYQKITLILS